MTDTNICWQRWAPFEVPQPGVNRLWVVTGPAVIAVLGSLPVAVGDLHPKSHHYRVRTVWWGLLHDDDDKFTGYEVRATYETA